jgi:recombination protein RecT
MATADPKAIEKVSKFMRSDETRARFADAIGDRNAGAYISSVMLAVANDDSGKLALCKPESVYISALRAATLRLSVDPSTGQAYMIAYGEKATLVVGYKGLYDMAVRTGKYRYINVAPIYEGVTITPNPISGLITLESLGGKKVSDKVIGWLGAFEMNPEHGHLTGYAHTLYMTVEEIHEHAKKYSRGYDYKNQRGEFTSLWHKNPAQMERKTVLRLLIRKWGYMDPSDAATLTELEKEVTPNDPDGSNSIDAEFAENVPEEQPTPEPEPTPEPPAVTIEHPLAPETLRSWLAANVKEIGIYQHTPEQMGLMNGMLTQAFAPDKDAEKIRRSCLRYLWGVKSSKELKGPQVKATLDWLKPTKDSGEAYSIDPMAAQELHSVWTAANIEAGQEKLI